MKAIILAGGFGTRIRSVIGNIPKAMAPISGRPFLEILVSKLEVEGFDEIYLSLHYLSEQIENYFKQRKNRAKIFFIQEETPLQTGGAILNCLKHIHHNEKIFIINGDSFFDVNYREMMKCDEKITLALTYKQDASRYGVVEIGANKFITKFCEKEPNISGYINAGLYLCDKVFLEKTLENFFHDKAFSFEKDFLEKKFTPIYTFISDGYFIDIGVEEDYLRAQKELRDE